MAPNDIENVTKVQAGYQAQTLSSYLGQPAPAPLARTHFVKPLSAEQERSSLDFFNILNFVLQYCPIHRTERVLRARFGKAGIGTGRKIDVKGLHYNVRKAMESGISDAWLAQVEVLKSVAAGTLSTNTLFGTRDHLKNNYLHRMVGAAAGISPAIQQTRPSTTRTRSTPGSRSSRAEIVTHSALRRASCRPSMRFGH